MTIYYAAIKWPVKEGPKQRDVANDLQILAMTLVGEWGWSPETVEDILIEAAYAALSVDDRH